MKPLDQKEYDDFLKEKIKDRIRRIEKNYSYCKGILHKCQQVECSRTWKPIPKEIVETNKNYCPSCVMSWSNRTDRFIGWREWTKEIPNCFYLWSLTDPKTGDKFWKCGRTEEVKEPGKRFPKKEQVLFNMKLEDFVVDDLIKTTTYENNFKHLMTEKNIKKVFPERSFHGKDETFQYNDGKSLFQEAIKLDPLTIIKPEKKKQEISPGYCLNKKRKIKNEEINYDEEKSKNNKKLKTK